MTDATLSRWQPYPAYKPSGVKWLGDIPAHWGTERLKYLTAQPITDGPHVTPEFIDEGVPFLSVDGIQEGELIFEGCRYISPEDHEAFKRKALPRQGDILLGKAASTGKIARVKVDFEFSIWSPLALIRPNARVVDSAYLEFAFKSPEVQSQIDVLCTSNTQKNISMDDIPLLAFAHPPLDEQRAIAAFLDHETTRLDALIAKKQRLIELLQEQRTALISQVVTKGLDPNVAMKDSGVEWLGEIPAHWIVRKLSFAAKIQTGVTLGKKYADNILLVTRPYLRVANVQDGYLDLETITEISIPHAEVSRYELRPGDVLMTEGGDFDKLGRGYIWEGQIEGCLHQNHIFAVRPDQKQISPHYLSALMTSLHGKTYFTSTSSQTTNLATTNSTKLKNFPLPLPSLDEQLRILEFLTKATAKLDALVELTKIAIERLREYRTALIAAAVTGKIKVFNG